MSKMKSISAAQTQAAALNASSSVSSVGQADIFNDLFDAMAIDKTSSQDRAGADANRQQQKAEEKKTKEANESKASDDETASKSEGAGKDDDENMSVEERREIEAAEQHRISMEELARQLNMALAPQPLNGQGANANNPFAGVGIVVRDAAADIRSALQGIDPKLLRKVDAQVLDDQLRKLTGSSELIDVRPPMEEALKPAGQEFLDSMSILTERNHFRMDELVSAKSYVSDQQLPTTTPTMNPSMKLEDLNLNPAGNVAGLSSASAQPTRVAAASAQRPQPRLETGQLDKINLKVESVILGSAKGDGGLTRIRMHPEELGQIDIRIQIKDKEVRAEIVTDNANARDSIMAHMPQIKAVLASENLMLDYFNARHDQNHFDQQQGRQAGQDAAAAFGEQAWNGEAGDGRSATAQELRDAIRNRVADNTLINVTV